MKSPLIIYLTLLPGNYLSRFALGKRFYWSNILELKSSLLAYDRHWIRVSCILLFDVVCLHIADSAVFL